MSINCLLQSTHLLKYYSVTNTQHKYIAVSSNLCIAIALNEQPVTLKKAFSLNPAHHMASSVPTHPSVFSNSSLPYTFNHSTSQKTIFAQFASRILMATDMHSELTQDHEMGLSCPRWHNQAVIYSSDSNCWSCPYTLVPSWHSIWVWRSCKYWRPYLSLQCYYSNNPNLVSPLLCYRI